MTLIDPARSGEALSFQDRIRGGEYDDDKRFLRFMKDLREWLVAEGVPKKYAERVAWHAWLEGHASPQDLPRLRYYKVYNVATNLVEIFVNPDEEKTL